MHERGIFKHEGYNFCGKCNEELFDPKFYGVKPGEMSLEEWRAMEARKLAEREAKIKQIEENKMRGPVDDFELPGCIKVAETVTMCVGL